MASNRPLPERVAERFLVEGMANFRPKSTGVDGVVIWISPGESSGKALQHGPRIKVTLGEKTTLDALAKAVSVRISDPPEFLGKLPGKTKQEITRFIERNRDAIMRHWAGEIDAKELADQLRPLGE
jgi:hypothetical protein